MKPRAEFESAISRLCAASTATLVACTLLLASAPAPAQPTPDEWLYSAEGNRLRRYQVSSMETGPLVEEIVVPSASDDPVDGRDVNGQICFFPDGSGRFLMGEDTDQSGGVPQGWGIFSSDGLQIGKLTATYFVAQPEPFGCAFAPDGTLFTSSVGEQAFGADTGQLIMWFPPYEGFPGEDDAIPYPNTEVSKNFCKLATDLGTASSVFVSKEGIVYVAQTSALQVTKFLPPFPTGPDADGGCGSVDANGSPVADEVNRELAIAADASKFIGTYSGLALARNGNLYAANVFTGKIAEFTLPGPGKLGQFVRMILDLDEVTLPHATGSPQGIAVDRNGTLYYADLNLVGSLPNVGPGSNGKVWRITFDEFDEPHPPEIVRENLAFPDGLGMHAPAPKVWPTIAGNPERTFFNHDESVITPANVAGLSTRWTAPAGAIISGSPSVESVMVPGEGRIRVVYFQAWDGFVYAVRFSDGRELWRFETEFAPVSFPNTAAPTLERVGGRDIVFVGSAQYLYALDAVTGEELWRFGVGTGCRDENDDFPGLCAFDGERNEIESTAIVYDDTVYFGMDVNDAVGGKGGFYAVHAHDGTMRWFFDLETGSVCRPDEGESITRYDGYHSEEELGLPAGFNSRPGCDFSRSRNGCSNVWSSPALDTGRGWLFVASSNCDTDDDAGTEEPPPPMPPYDEAIFALDSDGSPQWVWRPRDVDNADLAFGAVPNLFSIDVDGEMRDVVGIGGKDGTYYVIDREGVNVSDPMDPIAWDDDPASHLPADLPYWATHVVAGGDLGGILATAAVDEVNRRIYFGTAAGESSAGDGPFQPQTPTVHALDMDTGAVVWSNCPDEVNDCEPGIEASFGSTSGIPGVIFSGIVTASKLRAYETSGDTGTKLLQTPSLASSFGIGTGVAVIDGTVLTGTGLGFRTGDPTAIQDIASNVPSLLVALCVPGTSGCAACNDGEDNDGDGLTDEAEDPGCTSEADPSEVEGDLDYDGRTTSFDLDLFFASFGLAPGDPGYQHAADLDDEVGVTWLDYQLWLTAFRAENAPPPAPKPAPACGLLGFELLWAPALAAAVRRRGSFRRRSISS